VHLLGHLQLLLQPGRQARSAEGGHKVLYAHAVQHDALHLHLRQRSAGN